MNSQNRSKILLALSMAIFGTLAPFVRSIPVSSGELALWRAVLAVCFIGISLLVTGKKLPFASIKRALPLLLASGMAMGINWILLFEAYKYTTVSMATLSYYFAPVLVILICPILFRERMTLMQIFCSVMSTVGLVLIIGIGDVSAEGTHLLGVLLGLGAACFYASVILLNKFIKGVDGISRTVFQFLAAILILIPYVLLSGGVSFAQMTRTGWICLLVVGLIHTGLAYLLYFPSIKDLTGQTAALLSYIDPLVAILISVFFLHEEITVLQIIGGAMILGFTLLNELGDSILPKKKEIKK